MKTKVTFIEEVNNDGLLFMSEMKPGEICIIIDNNYLTLKNHIVMRTLDEDKFEIMDLTDFKENGCWTHPNQLSVKPYYGKVIFQRHKPKG